MITWKLILATMLFLQAPGKSTYSKVWAEEGSAPSFLSNINSNTAYTLEAPGVERPLQCSQSGNVACSFPELAEVVFNGFVIDMQWQRVETYDEGVHRYALIARSMEEVLREGEWTFPVGQSWRYLLVIALHESGFRRDVHSGLGSKALGDCKYRKIAKGKEVLIPGSCRSYGLFQALFSDPASTKLFGYRPKELVGVSEEATKRSVEVALKHLERAYARCARGGHRPFEACIFATYGGVALSYPGITTRVKTYNRAQGAPKELSVYVANLLQQPSEEFRLGAVNN